MRLRAFDLLVIGLMATSTAAAHSLWTLHKVSAICAALP